METAEFRRLVRAHQQMVFSLALRLTGDYGIAEEVAQDAFLDLFRCAGKLTDEDHIRFWLRRVTVHRATDTFRRRSRHPEMGAEEWTEEHDAVLARDEGAQLSTGAAARIEDLLQALPEPMRIAVVLRYQEEMLPSEIAEALEQPVATVKSTLQRALQLLRKKAAVTMKEYIR